MSSKSIAGMGAKHTPNTPEQPFGRIMSKIAEKLSAERGWVIHTNGDGGASAFFEEGLSAGAKAGKPSPHVKRFLPEIGHNGHADGIVILDESLIAKARALLIESKAYPIIPRFISLEGRDRATLTSDEVRLANLHARLVFQLLGENLDEPVTMVVCWTPDGAIDQSGMSADITGTTGIAIAVAKLKSIPVFNLQNSEHLKRICVFIGEPVPGISS